MRREFQDLVVNDTFEFNTLAAGSSTSSAKYVYSRNPKHLMEIARGKAHLGAH